MKCVGYQTHSGILCSTPRNTPYKLFDAVKCPHLISKYIIVTKVKISGNDGEKKKFDSRR
jgi:hypothetical protein